MQYTPVGVHLMPSRSFRIAAAAVIGLVAGLLIASAERVFGYGLLFTGIVKPIAMPLLWPARLLIPSAAGSPAATMVAVMANALLYAAAAAVADQIYARRH